jgi:hypothetical protein
VRADHTARVEHAGEVANLALDKAILKEAATGSF